MQNIVYILLEAYLGLCFNRWLPMFSTAKTPICLQLNWAFVCPHDVFKSGSRRSLFDVFLSKIQAFCFVGITYQLKIRAPSECPSQWCSTVRLLILYPREISSWWSWIAIVSSSNRICTLTISLISVVIFDSLPRPGCRAIDPVSKNCLRNLVYASPTSRDLAMPLLLPERPSCFKSVAMVGAFQPW